MSSEQKYLESQQEQTKKFSENGSTTLSQGSIQADDELKPKVGEKFEYINEEADKWPQWSVKPQDQKRAEEIHEALEQLKSRLYQTDPFMYSRGMSFKRREKILQNQRKGTEKSFFGRMKDKITGLFK